MKHLPNLSVSWLVLLLLIVTSISKAQELKTEASQYSASQAYKQRKLFDNAIKGYSLDKKNVKEDVQARMEYERQLLADPHTGKIPANIHEKELTFATGIEDYTTPEGRFSWFWKKRGPFNVGGRTRALAIDRTNENVILAGGVSGGLWRSEDQGKTWRKITNIFQHPSITCIAQDPRPGYGHIWYYGTGEGVGTSASATGAFYQGNGIFRSFNGGRSFHPARNTQDNDPVSFSPFDIVTNLAVDPSNGDVYASTRDGIHRSTDKASNFNQVLEGGFPNWTEVIVTSGGTFYAAIQASGTPNAGIFTSTDGTNWTNITPAEWSPASGRTVLGYAPSSENIVYAFSQDLSGGLGFLWEYNADSIPESAWTNLSGNLPNLGGSVGSLNTQTSYNMVVRVHPTNPNMVFVGGTNLYRSTTAFRTPAGQESWIGGYSPLNNVSQYTNQHPDQHELIFFPSDPNRALSANDGGIYLAEDITETADGAEPVTWVDLNNGYLTTQPYTVAFDPESDNQDLVSGFQDNGTWFTNSDVLEDPWLEDFGGDGSYAAIADGGLTRYVSAQGGVVYRLNFDEEGEFESFTRVQPAGVSGFSFIAPFILDPRNDNIMYMPAGNRIWRNNDLDGIPLFSNAPTSVNWTEMSNSAVSGQITSLDISRYPEANKLYFGTNNGGIYRIDNANIDASEVVDLSSGKGLPAGNVICITVDPNNSERVFAVFSNYGIPSIFYSKDAGNTWSDISGNLEENPDGTGSGASVRWLAIRGNDDGYYVGTSVGLFFARDIHETNQRWMRVYRAGIGETVVSQVKTRKDGFVAVATHGNGLFSSFDFVRRSETPKLSVSYLLNDYTVSLNAPDTTISIEDLFVEEDDHWNFWDWWNWNHKKEITITLTNSNPDLVTAVLDGDELQISYAPDSEGVAKIGLIATLGKETVAEGFVVNVSELPFYEQFGPAVASSPSQNFLDFGAIAQTAADVVVPEGKSWNLQRILAPGGANNSPILNSATVVIYADDEGIPGAEIFNSGDLQPISDSTSTNLDLELSSPVTLESGRYWISVYANLAFFPNQTQWFWSSQGEVVGQEGFFRDQANLFGLGAVNWAPTSVFGRVTDQVFQLFGTVSNQSGISSSELSPAQDMLSKSASHAELKIWPNPSASQFSLNFTDFTSEHAKEIVVYDLKGNIILTKNLESHMNHFVWDASAHPTGLYLIKVRMGNEQSNVYTVLKR